MQKDSKLTVYEVMILVYQLSHTINVFDKRTQERPLRNSSWSERSQLNSFFIVLQDGASLHFYFENSNRKI